MTMPSEQRYRELIDELRDTTQSFNGAKDDEARLVLGRRALREVMRYLWCDPEVLNGKLTKPLAVLRGALYDVEQGAKPKLLNPPRPEREDPSNNRLKPHMGKASGTAGETIQGSLAFALELLARGGMSTGKGADWVADKARQEYARCADGSPIAPRQIKNWRAEISRGKAPQEARETFERLRNCHTSLLSEPRSELKRRKCEFHAAMLIKAGGLAAPGSAPNQRIG
jgi:hypothetical protein